MICIRTIRLRELKDYDKLLDCIKNTHINEETIAELKNYVGLKCDKIIVENPYADKDYLSTYYIHYAKKYKEYHKKSYRLHLFKDDFYHGFVTLRPTCCKKIGRSYLNPEILLDSNAYLMVGTYKVNVIGMPSEIDCFPWMHQDPDISTCAHVSLWSILRYFNNAHSNYADMTMGEIVEKVEMNYDRKIPSKGLRMEQISNLLTQYNFSTLIRENNSDTHYLDELFAYIESGLPLVGILKEYEHAVSIIGHGEIDNIPDGEFRFEKIENNGKTETTDIILSTNYIDSIIVNDDNFFPYRKVYRKACNINTESKYEPKYMIDNIKLFIIPLYEKMQITYNEVYNRVLSLLHTNNLNNLPSPKVLRFFITSSNSYKKKALTNINEKELRQIVTKLNMPKFIWCVEISSVENYKKHLVDGVIIIDATSSSRDDYPWIFWHDKKTAKYYNGQRYIKADINSSPYTQYCNNLEEFLI